MIAGITPHQSNPTRDPCSRQGCYYLHIYIYFALTIIHFRLRDVFQGYFTIVFTQSLLAMHPYLKDITNVTFKIIIVIILSFLFKVFCTVNFCNLYFAKYELSLIFLLTICNNDALTLTLNTRFKII